MALFDTLKNPLGGTRTILDNVISDGGIIDNLDDTNDPIGINATIDDSNTALGNIFGRSGIVEDLFSDGDQVGKVARDVFAQGGVVNDLATGDSLGLDHLLDSGTLIGNLAGNQGVLDDTLSLLI